MDRQTNGFSLWHVALVVALLRVATARGPLAAPTAPASRSAGILYEVWHSMAATAMAQVRAAGFPQLTTEQILRSNGDRTLSDVYPEESQRHWASLDIWNAEPAELGFYCLSSKRTRNDSLPDCPMRSAVAARHARLLTSAGFDYIAVDITNWPQVNAATDVAVLRPLEVLFEEWLTLRARGVPTPQIAVWCDSPVASYADGHQTTWQWLLDHVYNNATRAPLVWSRPDTDAAAAADDDDKKNNHGEKMTFFIPATSAYNETVDAMIQSNGGRHNIATVKMWALNVGKGSTTWGFFSPCTTPTGGFTTSMVGAGDCNQYPAMSSPGEDHDSNNHNNSSGIAEISASGGYMLSQCSLPFASPGHLRGLTLSRLFKEVLEVGAPELFMSSFNEHIGGRQAPAFRSEIAFNMGLPKDPQRKNVWVDTYGCEFSRDIEPTVEGGSRIWEVASSCVGMYKRGLTCTSTSDAPCCTLQDKAVFANAWSLESNKKDDATRDALVTNNVVEKDKLVGGGAWSEICNAIVGPSVFCVNGSMLGGRNGPFMLYSTPQANMSQLSGAKLVPLHRCMSAAASGGKHFLSNSSDCEGRGRSEFIVGWVSSRRGWETLRALRRCERDDNPGVYSHALDLECDGEKSGGTPLGYVR
jgi:hypothetical protein